LLPADRPTPAAARTPLTRRGPLALAALLAWCPAGDLLLGDLRAAGQHLALVADTQTDRTIDLLVWSGEIPTTWFQA